MRRKSRKRKTLWTEFTCSSAAGAFYAATTSGFSVPNRTGEHSPLHPGAERQVALAGPSVKWAGFRSRGFVKRSFAGLHDFRRCEKSGRFFEAHVLIAFNLVSLRQF